MFAEKYLVCPEIFFGDLPLPVQANYTVPPPPPQTRLGPCMDNNVSQKIADWMACRTVGFSKHSLKICWSGNETEVIVLCFCLS